MTDGIDSVKILILILKQEHPQSSLRSAGLLVQAVLWYEEIKGIFIALGVPDEEIEPYADDYVNRIYLLKIKNTFLYFFSNFFNTLYNRTLLIFWGYTSGYIFRFFVLHFFLGLLYTPFRPIQESQNMRNKSETPQPSVYPATLKHDRLLFHNSRILHPFPNQDYKKNNPFYIVERMINQSPTTEHKIITNKTITVTDSRLIILVFFYLSKVGYA